jgi:rare lipoprotein A
MFDLHRSNAENLLMVIYKDMANPGAEFPSVRTGENKGRRSRVWTGLLGLTLCVSLSAAASAADVHGEDTGAPVEHTGAQQNAAKVSKGSKRHWFEIGKASWYGKDFNGKRTANGERFDMTAWTCAHRTLPLGSWVKVTNLLNRKTIFLRVNDRGPVPESNIVDLSYAAARKIGISGLGEVKIESVTPNDPRLIDQMVASVRPLERPQWPVNLALAR